MRLDSRLKDAILSLVKSKHPEMVCQEEIYSHIEDTVEFTEKQLELHIQNAGQIEPNWQHDARNIIHSLNKSNHIICPISETYGLPLYPVLEPGFHDQNWHEIMTLVKGKHRIEHVEFTHLNDDIKLNVGNSKNVKTIGRNLVQ
jgi:hypothetical protein